ncbi:putative 2-aminoethylphosphonate ABC transporter substrate-binding protein [Paenibacillus sp. YIM B09110]|uniref:putative 2-aminoethylphosphonate ABC transporter substrate-binding protein n=1 Tax=Paenibacillus sp. YIM B09110 TaxID=3126102 RepID=UPI00301E60A5
MKATSKKMGMTILSLALVMAILLTGCGGGTGSNNGGNKANTGNTTGTEGGLDTESKELTVYTALEDDIIQEYLVTYKAKYPDVKLNIVRDSTGVITAKLLAEKDNPQADVVWGLAATSLLVLDQNGMLEGYSPVGIERIDPLFKDANEPAKWVGIDAWETAFVANTVELEKAGIPVPQTYQDLIKPEYKGLITMPNPASSGTGYLTVSGLIQLLGEDEAWSYMDKLNENIAMYVHSGSKPAKLAGTGEYPIGISFGYRGIQEAENGAPVDVVFPTEGSGYDVEANALMKKGTIKQIAKDFLDWAITDEVMKEYNKNYAIIAIKTENTELPKGYTKDPMSQLIKNDLNASAKNREGILAEWSKRYDSKSEPKS